MAGLPRPFEQLGLQHRAVVTAYEALGEAGATASEIRQVVALAAPALGFPTPVAMFTWGEDILGSAGKRARR